MLNKIMNNLECRKQGFNKWICKRSGKEILLVQCKNCPYKEYKNAQYSKNIVQNYAKKCKKNAKMHNKLQNTVQIKKRTSKLNKLERDRFSLFTDDDSKCMLCGSTYQLTWNEIFRGKNRQLSMKYGLCQRLCLSCHMKYQEDPVFNEFWHKKGQLEFIKNHPELDFVKIFGKNYLK